MAKVNVRGATLEYSERGQGEPLVLVHGSVSDHRTWDHLVDEFAQRYRTINYSRRFHWPNEPIPAGVDYSMAEQVEDLQALLHALDAAPAHLVGHSYGAYLCLSLALRDQSLVRTLVLAEPPVLPLFVSVPPTPLDLLRLLATRPRTAMAIVRLGARGFGPAATALRRGNREAAIRALGTATLGRDAFRRLSDERLEQVRANLIDAEVLGSDYAPLDLDQIRGLQCPTLLMTGDRSPKVFPRLIDRLRELLPQAERCVVPGVSHIMHEDNPSAYVEKVLSFLARRGTARG
jgi:pimeloyl-ACP methyl ester carboxylesterase